MFDWSAYLSELRDNREEALNIIGAVPSIQTYRDALRFRVDADDFRDDFRKRETSVEVERTAEDVRDELYVASSYERCGSYGASKAQVELIVRLLSEKQDFARLGYNRLTKREASYLINDLQKGN